MAGERGGRAAASVWSMEVGGRLTTREVVRREVMCAGAVLSERTPTHESHIKTYLYFLFFFI
jgi:hypothetical protein